MIAEAVAVDDSGNIVVAGGNINTDGYFIMKYTSDLELLWSRRYDGENREGANDVAVDSLGISLR